MNSNDPLCNDENDPFLQEMHDYRFKKYVSSYEIVDLAKSKGSRGLTIRDIQVKFGASTTQAQRKLKYCHARRTLFTAKDLIQQGLELPPNFKNYRPQRYYPSTLKADILEKIKEDYRNVLLRTTGPSRSSYPLFQALEDQKANSFFEVFQLLPFTPTYIHKINLLTSIGKNNYQQTSDMLNEPLREREDVLGKNRVRYIYHPNGAVQIFVVSSKRPLKFEDDNDVNMFFSLMGQIKNRICDHIHDYTEDIVPEINYWILKQCDLNKDVPISDKAQVHFPDIQLRTAGKVFRMYVKSLGNKSVLRCEESKEFNKPLSSLHELIFPELHLAKKIDILAYKIENLLSQINSSNYRASPYGIPIIF